MNLYVISESIEWLEHKTKPLFVIVALALYTWELFRLAGEINPIMELDAYLVEALAALSIPFGVILLQEILELVAKISESNLISARHQFEIVLLVIVRSFFKKFAKVSENVALGEFGTYVQESVVKILAIIALMGLIYFFRRMAESEQLQPYRGGQTTNIYKQILVVFSVLFVLGNMLFVTRSFDDSEFVKLAFTAIIIIDALFLLLAIMKENGFLTLMFESALIIALIFTRFPLFESNILSYALSVLGVAFATAALYVMYGVAKVDQKAVVAE